MAGEPQSFRNSAIRGAIVTGAAQAAKVVLQMTSTVFLSRLLEPADFGVVAMVTPIVAFVALFQDLGLQQAIIQAKDVMQAEISRMFWLNTGLSVVIAFVLLLLGPVAGWFYGDPRVILLTQAWALPLLLSAVAAQHLALLNRAMRFRLIAALDVLSSVGALLVAILVAWLFRSYWALWASVTAGALMTAVLSWMASGWRPSDPRTRADTGHLLRFGLNLAGFNFLNYFSRNLDNVIVAKAFGSTALGYYDRSYKLLLAPLQNINAPIARVILPILARLRDDPARYRAAYMQAAGIVTFVCTPAIAALAIVSRDFVTLLLGARWAGAAPIFAWLGIAGVCQPLGNATGWLFISQHRTQEMFAWSIFASATTILSFFAGIPWGVTGIAAAYALGSLFVRQPLLLRKVGRTGPVTTRDLLHLQLPVLLSSLVCLAIMAAIRSHFVLMPVASVIVALATSYAAAFLLLVASPTTRNLLLRSLDAAYPRWRRRRAPIAAPGAGR